VNTEETRKIIEDIIECALSWCNDDNDDPAPIPPEWETVLPLLRAAPSLLEALKNLAAYAEKETLPVSLRQAYAAIAKTEGGEAVSEHTPEPREASLPQGQLDQGDDEHCPKSPDGHHEPAWSTATVQHDGDETYIDVNCLYCGRSGCAGNEHTLAADINW